MTRTRTRTDARFECFHTFAVSLCVHQHCQHVTIEKIVDSEEG